MFFSMWDAVTRFSYKPDAYLKRIEDARRRFAFVGEFFQCKVFLHQKDFQPDDVTLELEMLVEFAELSLKMWKALGKAGLLDSIGKYDAALRRLEQRYAKTDCKECGVHAPAHSVGCSLSPWK